MAGCGSMDLGGWVGVGGWGGWVHDACYDLDAPRFLVGFINLGA